MNLELPTETQTNPQQINTQQTNSQPVKTVYGGYIYSKEIMDIYFPEPILSADDCHERFDTFDDPNFDIDNCITVTIDDIIAELNAKRATGSATETTAATETGSAETETGTETALGTNEDKYFKLAVPSGGIPHLYPSVRLNTCFLTRNPTELCEIFRKVDEFVLTGYPNKLTFEYVGSECTWYCLFICESVHCRFAIRLYRFHRTSEHFNKYAIEMQNMEGSSYTFRSLYDDLHDRILEPITTKCISSSVSAGGCAFSDPKDDMICNDQSALSAADEEAHNAFCNTFTNDSKKEIRYMIMCGSISDRIDAIQLACSIYCQRLSENPTKYDRECINVLLSLFVRPVDPDEMLCVDWCQQHAMIALENIVLSAKYCEIVRQSDKFENFKQFLKIMIGKQCDYSTAIFKMKCRQISQILNT
jgi:hypothetical protein